MAFNLLLKAQLERFLDKLEPQIHTFATSSTAQNVVDKVAILNGFILGAGAKVTVRFTDTSSVSPSSGNITLNVNSTGAKVVKTSDDNTICTYEDAESFCNNKVQQFVYDGTNWVWIKGGTSSSGGGGSSSDTLIATFSGTNFGTFKTLFTNLYSYLSNLSDADLTKIYVILENSNTAIDNPRDFGTKMIYYYTAFNGSRYSFLGLNCNGQEDNYGRFHFVSIGSSTSALLVSATEGTTGTVYRDYSSDSCSTFSVSLYKKASGGGGNIPESDLLITTTEFQNLI